MIAPYLVKGEPKSTWTVTINSTLDDLSAIKISPPDAFKNDLKKKLKVDLVSATVKSVQLAASDGRLRLPSLIKWKAWKGGFLLTIDALPQLTDGEIVVQVSANGKRVSRIH